MRSVYLLALVPFAVALVRAGDPVVDKHVQTLQKAQSVTLKLSFTPVGGAPEDQTLTLSRPNLFRWETPTQFAVGDGTSIWTYDKAKKQYTKAPSTPEAIAKLLGANDVAWAWSAFFNPTFADQVVSVKKSASHRLRNVMVTDLAITRKDNRQFVVYVDDTLGIARGIQYSFEEGGAKKDVILFAKEVAVGDKPVEASVFAFTPPSDATDAAAAPAVNANGLKFADIKPILDQNCISCHSGGRAKKGIDLSTYAGVSRVVKAGNPNGSFLIRVVKAGSMPPTGPLPADSVDKLNQWVQDGAQQ
ncbi:MAG: outer-membrane lipoprotein carrier protein LolA [Fimbriimonadaceae bacterium]|nr:outer-membrane lipoprotein carrier protein LolA [Fimbriimonadaceae bacterium]